MTAMMFDHPTMGKVLLASDLMKETRHAGRYLSKQKKRFPWMRPHLVNMPGSVFGLRGNPLCVTEEGAKLWRNHYRNRISGTKCSRLPTGVFYVVQITPELDGCRVKVGFSAGMDARMLVYKTSAPTSRLIKTWPCRRLWEKTIIDALVLSCGVVRLSAEVFQVESLQSFVEKCDGLFTFFPLEDLSTKPDKEDKP